MRTNVILISVLLSVSLVFSTQFNTAVYADDYVNVCWGCDYDNDQHEIGNATSVCNYITALYNNDITGWYGVNAYGVYTTYSNIYSTASTCEDDYDYTTIFHTGDAFPSYQNGTKHYYYYDNNDYAVRDDTWSWMGNDGLYHYTGEGEHLFVFIYTCMCANLVGYWDSENDTGCVGMAYAWHNTNSLSPSGYTVSWGDHCFIGFQNVSIDLSDDPVDDGTASNMADFVKLFYDYLVDDNYSVKNALNAASNYFWGINFGSTNLYLGYEKQSQGITWDSSMRVFGNGNLLLPEG